MSKYYLVASYYDLHKKTYQNETIISIPGVDLSTLSNIDNFTSSNTSSEIFRIIREVTKNPTLNHLVIKHYKNKNAPATRYHVIENNPDFTLCTIDNKTQNYKIDGNYITTRTVPKTAELFQREKTKLLQLIEQRDIEEFNLQYPYNNNLKHLVTRYINSSYDDLDSQQQELNLIITEFSNYKTFRGWIVAQEKKKNYYQQISKTTTPKVIVKPKYNYKPSNKTIEELADSYQKEFQSKNGISYSTYQANQHNLQDIDEDKEEFLDEKEVEEAYYQDDSSQNTLRRYR